MSTPIATPSDLALFLNLDLATLDQVRAEFLIGLVQGEAEDIVSPLPASTKGVILSAAGRAYTNPQNVQQETTGPYSVGYGAGATGGLYLSKQDRAALQRAAGRGGAFTFDTMPATAGQNLPWWDAGSSGYPFDVIP